MEVIEDLMKRIDKDFFESMVGEVQEKGLGRKPPQKIEQTAIKKLIPPLKAWDPLLEVNLGSADDTRLTKISGLLSKEERATLLPLITQNKNFFSPKITLKCRGCPESWLSINCL